MLIVAEGPDGSGKTTLLNRLAEDLPKPLFKLSRVGRFPTIDAMLPALRILERLAKDRKLVTLSDRDPLISELVYGRILRGGGLFSDNGQETFHEATESLLRTWFQPSTPMCYLILYCRPSIGEIAERSKACPQMLGVEENLPRLIEAYDQFFHYCRRHSKFAVLEYDGKPDGHNGYSRILGFTKALIDSNERKTVYPWEEE